MPELLIFAYDHEADPNLSAEQLAALPSLHDLIDWKPDGGVWGMMELANPWFRVLVWPQADEGQLQALMSPLLPVLDTQDELTTLWQYRSHYLDAANPAILAVPDLQAFFLDQTRTDAKFFVPADFSLAVEDLTLARPDIRDPSYSGSGANSGIILGAG